MVRKTRRKKHGSHPHRKKVCRAIRKYCREHSLPVKKNIKVVPNTEVEYADRRERYVNIPHVILIELLESNLYTLCR